MSPDGRPSDGTEGLGGPMSARSKTAEIETAETKTAEADAGKSGTGETGTGETGTGETDAAPLARAALGHCPRCGRGRLFSGFLGVAPACDACGLDLGFAEAGDGPAVLVILVVGFVVVGLALWAEVVHAAPLWLHFILWPPLTPLLALPMLRVLKGAMIGQQYRTGAAEFAVRAGPGANGHPGDGPRS